MMNQHTDSLFERLLFGPQGKVDAKPQDATLVVEHETSSAASTPSSEDVRSAGCGRTFDTQDHQSHKESDLPSPITSASDGINDEPSKFSQVYGRLRRSENEWQPTIVQPRALVGIAALLIAVVCVFASYAVLKISHGMALTSWPIKPNVYLAVITAIANSAILLARMEAVPIAWWYSATRGRTVQALERQWQVSRSVTQAVRYGHHMSLLNLACIMAALVVVDGPFLQRASTVSQRLHATTGMVELRLPPELPTGFGGVGVKRVYYSYQDQNEATNAWFDGVPISSAPLRMKGCYEDCTTTVLAPGLYNTGCTFQTWILTENSLTAPNSSNNVRWGPPTYYDLPFGDQRPAFYVMVIPGSHNDYEHYGSETATIVTGRLRYIDSKNVDRGREFIQKTCVFRPAILSYKIGISGGNISLPSDPDQAKFASLANNTKLVVQQDGNWNTTMDVITTGVLAKYIISMQYFWDEAKGVWAIDPSTQSALTTTYIDDEGAVFIDPLADIVSDFNNFMFRSAVKAARWTNVSQLLDPGVEIFQKSEAQIRQLTFISDMAWFAGAAIIQLGAVLLILPMFWGFWTLGSDTSLSPFNIALAFDSPLLKDINSGGGKTAVVRQLGGIKLKFGNVDEDDLTGKHEADEKMDHTNKRLGFANAECVKEPCNGRVRY